MSTDDQANERAALINELMADGESYADAVAAAELLLPLLAGYAERWDGAAGRLALLKTIAERGTIPAA